MINNDRKRWHSDDVNRTSVNHSGQESSREGGARPRFSRPRFTSENSSNSSYGYRDQRGSRSYTSDSVEPTSPRTARPRFRMQHRESSAESTYSTERSERRSYSSSRGGSSFGSRYGERQQTSSRNSVYSKKKQLEYQQRQEDPTKPIRLNKFLANAGFCSRREADDFIRAGVVTVNGQVVSTLGAKVLPTDDVMFNSQHVRREHKVYILLNKPKNTVTTSDDPQGRQTVLDIVSRACSERIYPVGRLDRNTTGVLLLTNDGDLAAKLTHPKFGKKKVYAVTLDRDLDIDDEQAIREGTMLDDELIVPDALEFTKDDRRHIGLEIHSGQNRVVRRIFEKVGYKVMQLDRVSFAGLTKKNLPRGKYRFLTPKEVSMLQMGAFE